MNKKQRIRLSEANVMGANNPINQNNPKTSSDIEGGKSFFKLAVQNWTNRAIDPDNPKTWPNDAQSVFQIAQKFQNYPTQGAGWAKNILQLTHNKELVNHFKSVINNYHAQNNVQKLTESQLRRIIKESVRRVLNENVGDVRVISHGEWSDPEVEWEKSHYQKPLYNYWDATEGLDDDFTTDDLKNNLYDLTPSDQATPDVYYDWSFEDSKYHHEDTSDGTFMTKGMCLKDALETLGSDTGELTIELTKNGRHFPVYKVLIKNGSIMKDLTNYSGDTMSWFGSAGKHRDFENEPLNEARLRRIVNNAIKSVTNKKHKY